MKDKNLTYKDALQLVHEKIKGIENLRAFCDKYGINYNVALSIKNGKAKRQYPTIILKFLKAFSYKAELRKETYYVLK
jgi:hypothetical protein